jgi:2-polyprenyl-3-methyl-5-hydroxy-6-metoxy-1,4-benzoquinol methylase
MNQISRPCPICNIDDAVIFFDNRMAAVADFDMSYTVVRCKHCGFYFAQKLADLNTLSSYYQTVSKYDLTNSLTPMDQRRIEFSLDLLTNQIGKNSKIADLGCGTGAFLGALKKAGWKDLQGIDPAPNASMNALKMYDIHGVMCGNLSNAHEILNLDAVDLICIMSVLEHLPNLRQDLTRLFSRLKFGCRIFIEVPAVEFFTNPESEPFGEFSLEHIQYFDSNSLHNLMNSLGAETLELVLVELPIVASGALIGLFEWKGQAPLNPNFQYLNTNCMEVYKDQSQEKLNLAISRIPDGPLIIYGAGSHTARLLTHLEVLSDCSIHSIVDNNPNLVGKKIGKWTVQPTSVIAHSPEIPVLVSSFRSQNAIAAALSTTVPNPIILMYQ